MWAALLPKYAGIQKNGSDVCSAFVPHFHLCSAFNVDPIYQKVVLSGSCLSHSVHPFQNSNEDLLRYTLIIPRLCYQYLNQIDI